MTAVNLLRERATLPIGWLKRSASMYKQTCKKPFTMWEGFFILHAL
ncbi:hypothetical protein MHH52_21300 [Paenibacillus sp. FSL K6-0276]